MHTALKTLDIQLKPELFCSKTDLIVNRLGHILKYLGMLSDPQAALLSIYKLYDLLVGSRLQIIEETITIGELNNLSICGQWKYWVKKSQISPMKIDSLKTSNSKGY